MVKLDPRSKRMADAVVIAVDDDETYHGMIVVWRTPHTDSWYAELFVNGGSVEIIYGRNRDKLVKHAEEEMLTELESRKREAKYL